MPDDRVQTQVRPAERGLTFVQAAVSLAGAVSVAALVPLAILVVGIPVALGVRGLLAVLTWLAAAVG
jgi:hypothetical protein